MNTPREVSKSPRGTVVFVIPPPPVRATPPLAGAMDVLQSLRNAEFRGNRFSSEMDVVGEQLLRFEVPSSSDEVSRERWWWWWRVSVRKKKRASVWVGMDKLCKGGTSAFLM
jgi:hypothetical protein